MRSPASRGWIDRVALTLPLIGDLLAKIDTARLARTVGTLLVNGVALPNALAIAKGDEDFRLLVDRTLSRLNQSGDTGAIFARHFGNRSPALEALLLMGSLPE